ncbi:MAG TPA: lipoate--protein ligase family protein [Roseiflexaceae bacterium]|jgi:lipoate-protein ligase A|nr:lipoate--protein ligase family protein [Roseiflexaceae bacterium]
MENWRLLIDAPADGAMNMARDEALLHAHAAGMTPPTIRLYQWQPACLSLGRFQRSGDVDWEACARGGVDVVRRLSGGRALLHADELTYAVIARTDHPLFAGRGSILHSYHDISLALLHGLQRLGVAAELAPAARRRAVSMACFDTPAAFELTVGGRKLVGSAQARREGVLLQHGALPFSPHAARLQSLLTCAIPDLNTTMMTLDEALERPANAATVADALVAGFQAAWNIALEPGTLIPEEQTLEHELRASRYANAAWTRAR